MGLYWLSYAPYGYFSKLIAVNSSVFVFYLIWDLTFNRNIKVLYILPFLTLNWLYFQSPFLLKEKTKYYNRIINEEYVDEIALYCGLSISLIFIGYHFFLNSNYKSIASNKLRFKKEFLIKLIYLFVFLGTIFRLGEQFSPVLMGSLSNLIQLLPYSATIVFGFYLLLFLRGEKKSKLSTFDFIVIIFLLADFLIRLSTTLFSEVAILFSGPLLVYFRERGKLPVVSILISLIILVPLYQTRKFFRLHSEEVKEFSGGGISKGKLLLENAYTLKNKEEFQKLQEQGEDFNRFENLSFISHVVLQHKKGIKPFLNGETFYWLPLVPIPVFIII